MSIRRLNSIALFMALSFLIGITACHHSPKGNLSSSDNLTDAEIYEAVLIHCAEADSAISLSEGKIVFEEGPVKKLLLLDSTLVVPMEKLKALESMVNDSTLLSDFYKKSQVKAEMKEGWSHEIQLRRFPRQTFDRFLKLNMGNGFMELYKKFPGISGIVEFSKVGYNSVIDQALVEISYYKSPEESFRVFYLLKKAENKWLIVDQQIDS
jgi:hypothetical protein